MSKNLSDLAKSFEPANIEAQWGPEWEKRGIATATLEANKDN